MKGLRGKQPSKFPSRMEKRRISSEFALIPKFAFNSFNADIDGFYVITNNSARR